MLEQINLKTALGQLTRKQWCLIKWISNGKKKISIETSLISLLFLTDSELRLRDAFTLGLLAWSEPEFVRSPSPCPRWTAFILFYLGPNRGSFASSSQQLFPPLLSNDGAEEEGKMHNIALCTFIYLRFWTVRFVYKA